MLFDISCECFQHAENVLILQVLCSERAAESLYFHGFMFPTKFILRNVLSVQIVLFFLIELCLFFASSHFLRGAGLLIYSLLTEIFSFGLIFQDVLLNFRISALQ